MSDTSIELVVRFSIKPGNLEAFRAKVKEIATAVEAEEPSTVAYTTYVDPEGKAAILIERFTAHAVDGVVWFPAAAWLVTATRADG